MNRARLPLHLWSFCALVLCTWLGAANADTVVVYPKPESSADSRYQYDWAVLRTALEKTRATAGPFEMKESAQFMSPARVTAEALMPGSEINVFVRATSIELEQRFRPVRIPVDRGLLGYRVFLVRPADLPKFGAVQTLDDLRKFTVGQGKGWVDVAILSAARFTVIEGNNYEGLFPMLAYGRFDFFSRSVDEALREFDERHESKEIAVEPTLLLYYPLPRYFFVRRDAAGEHLARRIEAGLEIMIRDGSLNGLFNEYKGALIKRSGLNQRRLFRIPNPALSPETPLERPELWYTPPAVK
jgi:hypothetical protein